jgi:hypothetical protein
MTYSPRIQADPDYIHALGRAFYNFTYLEWVVVWTIVKLSADGFVSVPKGQSAKFIATALHKAIDSTSPSLPSDLRLSLVNFHKSYLKSITQRNKLLHAHPHSTANGSQQLGGGGVEWPIDHVIKAAMLFEEYAIQGNAIFHGPLSLVRP